MRDSPGLTSRAVPAVLPALLLALVAACGGGGTPPAKVDPPALPPGGLTGRVYLRDYHLGRIVETEPNDVSSQPGLLPPLAARSRLEVAGHLASTALRFGRVDDVDVLRFTAIEAQDIVVQVDFTTFDPLGGLANDVLVEARSVPGEALLAASVGGGTPQTLTFTAAADVPVDVVFRIRWGHAAYLARFDASDPAVPPAVVKPEPFLAREATAPGAGAVCAPGHVIARVAEGADPAAVAARAGLVLGEATGTGSWRFRYPPEATVSGGTQKASAAAKALRADPDVVWSEPDWVVRPLALPSDPDYPRQWHLRAIAAQTAWEASKGSPDVVVAVVDTGTTQHPDLDGQTVPGFDFISDPDIAGDGDGRDADPTDLGDQGDSSGLSTWHGTFVSSLVVGRHDDGNAGAGVAPGCRVMPLRAIGTNGGLVSDVAAAILYAAGIGDGPPGQRLPAPVRIVNLSLGLDQLSAELRDACDRAANVGCLLVGASGNSGGAVQYPAAFGSVLAVGAVSQALNRAWYSSFGPELDLASPGGDSRDDVAADGWPDGILSAIWDETLFPHAATTGLRDGTSGAAPQVAGAAALLWSIDPTLTAFAVRNLLTTSALDRGTVGRDDAYGFGLLQVGEAVRRLKAQMGQPLASAPSLHLLQPSLRFHGLEMSKDVPVTNGGGGTLQVAFVETLTDDGSTWLTTTLVPGAVGAASTVSALTIRVDRTVLPTTPGRWSATIRLSSATAPLGSFRIAVYVQDRQHAGADFTVIVQDPVSGYAPAKARASPQAGYRYWFQGLPVGTWNVRAGEDLDGDGFSCEGSDACGWHGGRTEGEAIPVTPVDGVATTGVDIVLYAPTPP